MKISKLEKANKIYSQIKMLDNVIIELDKFAHLVVGNSELHKIELSLTENKKSDDKGLVQFDEDGSLIKKDYTKDFASYFMDIWSGKFNTGGILGSDKVKSNDSNNKKMEFYIEDTSMLIIIGIIMNDKQRQRNKLINQLQKIGVEL